MHERERLAQIVGQENVVDDRGTLEAYSKDQSFVPPLLPWCVVRPNDTGQVAALVEWANETRTPLVPISSGPPHFHGDTVPSAPETTIVDLSRMKAIKRIDRRNRIALIEPGVTYSELEPALAEEGLRITRPLMPRTNKSVVASLLERQPTLIPRLNYSLPEPLRNCGVVWGTGEIAYTGEAGLGPLSLDDQWAKGVAQVDPKGPNATDLMRLVTGAQGTMGIVTWASVRCELLPAVQKHVFVPAQRLEDLIDFCHELERTRLGNEVLIVNAAQLARMVVSQFGEVRAVADELPAWIVIVRLAGAALYPREKLDVQEHRLTSMLQSFALTPLYGLPHITSADIVKVLDGYSGEPHWKVRQEGGSQDIFFLTTLGKAPEFVATACSIAEELKYPASEIGVYIQPQHQGVSQHVELNLPYEPEDARALAKAREIHRQMAETLVARGAYFSRPYGSWSDLVYSRDATAKSVLRTVKHIVDPNNVLNPGKLCF
jgi:FAD/FMN-containing dehydrogenase